MITVQVQNETTQTEYPLQFVAVPRIGEGVHLLDRGGALCSFDVVDVWYQKATFGEIWVPHIHVRKSGDEAFATGEAAEQPTDLVAQLKQDVAET